MSNHYRLGVIVPGGGSAAVYTPMFRATAELAAYEINQRGGVLGREIELSTIHFGPRALHDSDELTAAIDDIDPHGLVLLHTSQVRELMSRIVDGRLPIYYPPIWEGGAEPKGIICTGESPEVKVWPAIKWLADNASATDWMIVGTDYAWPSGTARAVEPQLSRNGWWHGTHLVPYSLLDDLDDDERVVRQLIETVESSSASCVLVLLHGAQMAMFNREFAARGLDERVLRFAPMCDEAVLLASGPETTRGLLTAFGVLDCELRDGQRSFADRYASLHGTGVPEPSSVTFAGYEGVAVASEITNSFGTLTVTARDLLAARARGFAFDGPTGRVEVSRRRTARPMNLLAADGIDLAHVAHLS